MSATLAIEVTDTRTTDDDELCHLYCCDENISWCGLDLTDHAVIDITGDEGLCIVCDDLDCSDEPCRNPDCPYRD